MKCFAEMNKRKRVLLLFALVTPVVLYGCKTNYTFQLFAYPPGSRPDEYNWENTLSIFVSTKDSRFTKKTKKDVRLRIYNKDKVVILDENYEFISAAIDANVTWEKFERVSIELVEVGNEFSEDPYNKQLVESGPNRLLEIIYIYENKTQTFKRVPIISSINYSCDK